MIFLDDDLPCIMSVNINHSYVLTWKYKKDYLNSICYVFYVILRDIEIRNLHAQLQHEFISSAFSMAHTKEDE